MYRWHISTQKFTCWWICFFSFIGLAEILLEVSATPIHWINDGKGLAYIIPPPSENGGIKPQCRKNASVFSSRCHLCEQLVLLPVRACCINNFKNLLWTTTPTAKILHHLVKLYQTCSNDDPGDHNGPAPWAYQLYIDLYSKNFFSRSTRPRLKI
jgi:hypothetical protein